MKMKSTNTIPDARRYLALRYERYLANRSFLAADPEAGEGGDAS